MRTFPRRVLALILVALVTSLGAASAAPIEQPEALTNGWACWPAPGAVGCNRDLYAVAVVPGDSTNVWAVGEAGTILHWNSLAATWDPVPSPTTHHLYAIAMVSATDGWAVGSGGAILRWNGTAWNLVGSPTAYWLRDVHMVSASDGWAVGDFGAILRWNGSAWSQVSSPTLYSLNGIDMLTGTEGWVVGNNGAILRWNGSAWSQVASPAPKHLLSVDMLSATDGWAVGEGVILRWNGMAWTQVVSPTTGAINAVSMVSSAAGWAAAAAGLVRWNGTTWSMTPNTGEVNAVLMVSGSDGWAVGDAGKTLHWGGTAWGQVTSPTAYALNAVQMLSPTNGWAVGGQRVLAATNDATILHWDGSAWSLVPNPGLGNLQALSMVSDSDGWAAGVGYSEDNSCGTGLLLRWNGTAWSSIATDNIWIWSIDMISPTDGWFTAQYNCSPSTGMFHWDGNTWTYVNFPCDQDRCNLLSVDMVSSNDGWAVGYEDDFYHGLLTSYVLRWNGAIWVQTSHPVVTDELRAVAGVSSNDAWAVGNDGVILHWNGAVWSQVPSPTLADLYDVTMFSANDGWIVGEYGFILHWDGASWTQVASPSGARLQSVSVASPTEGWAVGGTGNYPPYGGPSTMLRFTYQPEALFQIDAGWNMLALPLDTPSAYTAQSLLDDINGQGGTCSEVDRWLNGGWDAHVNNLPFNNFPIELGEGYFTRCAAPSAWTIEGQPPAGPLPIDLTAGWNLISIHEQTESYLAQSLLDAINTQGGACTEINRWLNGGWDAHIHNLPFNNFAIVPEEGYFVKCTRSSNFLAQVEAQARSDAAWEAVAQAPGVAPAEHPAVTGVQVIDQQQDSLTIAWRTDQASQGWVEYGPTPALGLAAYDDRGIRVVATDHSVTLPRLKPGTITYYRVHSGQTTVQQDDRPFEAGTLP